MNTDADMRLHKAKCDLMFPVYKQLDLHGTLSFSVSVMSKVCAPSVKNVLTILTCSLAPEEQIQKGISGQIPILNFLWPK